MVKNLRDILYKAGLVEITGSTDIPVSAVEFDSRKVTKGALFVAVRGLTTDGHLYIDQAIKAGAKAVVCGEMPGQTKENITYIKVNDPARALGVISANFFDNPSRKLKLVGITGTNGKTTVATLLHELFQKLGHPTGLISTVKNLIAEKEVKAVYTTPDPVQINRLLNDMVDAGCAFAFMEVSSHAIAQRRIDGLEFKGGVFTNLSHDHLDYHKTFKEYLNIKKRFFDNLDANAFSLTNLDDKNGWVMLQNTKAAKKTYSLNTMADYKGKVIENSFAGLHMQIDGKEVWCKLVGAFNAYNLLAVYATARLLGAEKLELLTALSSALPAEGRFDYFKGRENITGIIDYAHTPDAVENVLKTIQEIRSGKEKVITILGCGGNRDTSKRPVMASIGTEYSDKLILTSDNPRFEDPEKIIDDMKTGLDPVSIRKTITVINRKEAINTACALANEGDIILVAGKGHEKYQEVNGVKHPFDDKEILKSFLT